MNCNKLKISILQFNGDNKNAICKLTIKIDNKTHIGVININELGSHVDCDLINLIDIYEIAHKIAFVAKLARNRMQNTTKYPYGIDVYWKWDKE